MINAENGINKMGLIMHLKEGTGRAMCQLCDKKIEKGSPCLIVAGWNTSGQSHINRDDCFVIDNMIREKNWKGRIER